MDIYYLCSGKTTEFIRHVADVPELLMCRDGIKLCFLMRIAKLFFLFAAFVLSAGNVTGYAADNRVGGESSLVEKKGPTVTSAGNYIDLWSDEAIRFEIYSITGQLIKTVNVPASTHVKIELPKGFYIVKCEIWTRRVMVK